MQQMGEINERNYHIDELRQLQFDFDRESVADVGDGSYQFVVVGEQVVIKPLSVRIRPRYHCRNSTKKQRN